MDGSARQQSGGLAITGSPPRAEPGVRDLVQSARHGLEDATAEQIVAWAAQTFGDRWAVASSMANGTRPPDALDRNGVIRNAA